MKPVSMLHAVVCALVAVHLNAADDIAPWGIASSASGMKNVREWMPKMRNAGAAWVRMFPEWGTIERPRGTWNWDAADAIVRAAEDNDLQVSGILMGAVPGAGGGSHTFPMSDLDGWAKFVGQSVGRYKGRIRYWEVWNEGNGGFNDGKHTAADYAKLAAAAYVAAKAADPGARMALTTASFDPDYLRHAILAQQADGKPAQFDHVCIHPYEIADGVSRPDGEIPYLWMSRLMRDALKACAPEKANAEIWITEIGRNVAHRKDQAAAELEASAALIKLYTMALAQDIRCVQWFEAQDPAGEEPGFGLLKRDGTPRETHLAFTTMITVLGQAPEYVGWITPGEGGRAMGLVFNGAGGPVMVAWTAAGSDAQKITFAADVQLASGTKAAGREVTINEVPAFVTRLPATLVNEARANKERPFPWGGDYSTAKSVRADPGSTVKPFSGLFQTGTRSMPKVTFPDGSTGILMSANQSVQFFVHPSFASVNTKEYHVRITVRRVTPGNVGMNLVYEKSDTQGRTPYKNQGTWFGLNKEDGWQTFTWHVKDACFAKMWGYDISFVPEQSQPFVIGAVEVSTQPF